MTDFVSSSARHPVLDHPTRAFVARHTCPPSVNDPDLEQARLDLARLQGKTAPDPLDEEATSTEWFALPGGPTGHVRVQVVRPADSIGEIPVVLFLHGLGWALGDADTHERLVRAFALGTDAAVVFVEYERAPRRGIRSPSSSATRSRSGSASEAAKSASTEAGWPPWATRRAATWWRH